MKGFSILMRILPIAFASVLLGGCGGKSLVRQKMTVSVETPAGVRAASSILQVSYEPPLLKGPAAGFDHATITRTGEAVVMDFGGGRYLFALLNGVPDPWEVFFPGQGPQATVGAFKTMTGQTRDLTPRQYPLLVTFGDINDPASVKRVDPDHLEASFGPGYRLQSISMSITDEPVTKGEVEKVLGWLSKPSVMENPGWSILPLESRRAIGGLLSYFPNLKG